MTKKIFLLLGLVVSFSVRPQEANINDILRELINRPEKQTSNEVTMFKKTISMAGKVLKFSFDNCDKILSKKALSFAIIIGAPYFYCKPEALVGLSQYGSDFVIKMNGLMAEGILNGIARNPKAVTQLMTLWTVQQTGQKMAERVGIEIAKLFLWAITLGNLKG